MEAVLLDNMVPPSPYRGSKGGVDIQGLFELLAVDQSTLAKALGVSRQAVSQQLASKQRFVRPKSADVRKFWDDLNDVVALLLALTDGNNKEEEVRLWLRSPNKALGLDRPIDLVIARNLEPLKTALMDAFIAAHGG